MSEQPEYGGHLRIARNWPIPSDLNPYIYPSAFSVFATHPMWASLFRQDENGTLQPDLAVNYTTTNGVDFVINLVNNATWHDGVPFTSDDAIFTLELLINRTDPLLDKWWVYQLAFHNWIESIEKLNDYSFLVHLNETDLLEWYPTATDPTFPVYLDRLPIIAKHVYSAGLQLNGPIVGTGQFKLSSLHIGENMTLTVNTEYFKGRPYLDNITYRWDIPMEEFAQNILNNGVDLASCISWRNTIDPDELSEINDAPGVSYETVINDVITFVGMNFRTPILTNLTIRQGISMAIDKQKICSEVWRDYAMPAIGYLCPGWGEWYNPNVPQYPYDPLEAQRLLNGTDLNLKLIVGNYLPYRLNASRIVAQNLRDAGINLTVVEYSSLGEMNAALASGDFDLAMMGIGWGNANPDGPAYGMWFSDGWLASLFGFSNATIDDMIEQARISLNHTEKRQTHCWIQGNISHMAPAAFLYWRTSTMIQNNDFHGFTKSSCINLLDPIVLEKVYYKPTLSTEGKSPMRYCYVDSEGRITGEHNGSVYGEIPDSVYRPEENLVLISYPEGQYSVILEGTGNGTYSLELVNLGLGYRHQSIPHGVIRENQTREYVITVQPDGSISLVDCAVDLDGDNDCDIYDIVIMADAYGTTPWDSKWDVRVDIVPPIDSVDIYDVVAFVGEYRKTW